MKKYEKDERKTGKILFSIGIVCLVLLPIIFEYNNSFEREIQEVPCYDDMRHEIQGLICEKKLIINPIDQFIQAILLLPIAMSVFGTIFGALLWILESN